ncbi:MAG: hypothetical protein K6L75_13985 [Cellvibrionaceae bacterium]
MKTLLKIIIGIVVVFVLAIGAVFFFTGDMVKTGDSFFESLKAGDIDAAYSFLSEDFKSSTNEEEFRRFIQDNALSGFEESSWAERSISGGRGVLTGSISTAGGGVVPLKLSFVKGPDGWKIYSVEKPSSGFQEESNINSVPSEQKQIEMVMVAAKEFAIGVNAKNSENFYKTFSGQFKQQFTIEKLNEIYKPFFDSGIDLLVLQQYSPVFDEKATIDEDGVLSLKGFFPTEPNKFYFKQTYIYEGLGWKLLGYSVNIE